MQPAPAIRALTRTFLAFLSQGNPPAAIKLVLEAVCVMLDVKPAKVLGGVAPGCMFGWGMRRTGEGVTRMCGGADGVPLVHGWHRPMMSPACRSRTTGSLHWGC